MGLQRQTKSSLAAALANRGAFKEILALLEWINGPGDRYFVDSNAGASTNDGKSEDRPLATLAQAIAKCTASNGDRIFLMPGHAETLTAAIAMSSS